MDVDVMADGNDDDGFARRTGRRLIMIPFLNMDREGNADCIFEGGRRRFAAVVVVGD